MTRTENPTPTPQPVTDPATAALVRIIGVFAIICLCAIGYLMVQKSFADSERAGRCVVYQSRESYAPVPLECR